MIKIEEGHGKHKVFLSTVKSGEDLTVVVYGGEKPHIGAIAISIPRPSLKDSQKTSTSTSVITLVGHKEDDLAKNIAEDITRITKSNTIAVVGLHVEKASTRDIEILILNTKKLVNRLKNLLKENRSDNIDVPINRQYQRTINRIRN